MISLTIERTALSLADLIIPDYPASATALWLPEDGLGEPDFEMRVGFAPDSLYIPGQKALAAVLDASAIPLIVKAQAPSTAALQTLKNELAAAVSQWAYDVTVTVDGVAQTWASSAPTWPKWGAIDSGMVKAHLAQATFTIPVNPT